MSRRPPRAELLKDRVHDSGGEQNLPIGYRHRRPVGNRTVEGLDQVPHAGVHVKVSCQKSPQVPDGVSDVLFRKYHRRDELVDVARELPAAKLDQCLVILIENQTILGTIDTKLMDRGTYLRGEGEIGRALLFTNEDPEFIDDVGFA